MSSGGLVLRIKFDSDPANQVRKVRFIGPTYEPDCFVMQLRIVSILFALLALTNSIELVDWMAGGEAASWYLDTYEWAGKAFASCFYLTVCLGVWKRWYWVKFLVFAYVGVAFYLLLILIYGFYGSGGYSSNDVLLKIYIGVPVLLLFSAWVCVVCQLELKGAGDQ